jgi:hypothetical protein
MRRAIRHAWGAVLVAAAIALFLPTSPAEAAPALRVTAAEDVLGLTSRLVFSTVRAGAADTSAVTLHNLGALPIRVTHLGISGQNAGTFRLVSGQPSSFTIGAHRAATVGVRFQASTPGNKFAVLTITNTSATPNYQVRLRGVRAVGVLGDTEPQLAQLMQLFGYTTRIGFSGGHQATTRALRGDEVHAPYFVRANAGAPVRLVPIARYTGDFDRSVDNGHTPYNSPSKVVLFRFLGQNQKTFPTITSGRLTFSPSGRFGLYANINNYSDDRFNRASDGTLRHNLRVYPARGPSGRIANAWIIGVDVKTNGADKNYDYQDQVMLLLNARPA